ncbi:hypothetical protein GWI33_007583 [Rhynchophorus ferrugineus]|uniref:G domain-containing protein n=1 Tax=Rhynchophorus ferrugineus TaxID=354439 RepID=A0A834IHL1_RHYFE|nr:hypothetical protein GWI33_007583 [Rhynchophorus ferrugineus]
MFVIKNIGRFCNNFTYCRLRILRQYTNSVNEKFQALIEKYEHDVLFNSVIESNRLHLGYKENNLAMMKRIHYEEKLKTVFQTIQPIPISLKYYSENHYCEEKSQSPEESQHQNNEEIKRDMQFPFNMKTEGVKEVPVLEKTNYTIKNEIMARNKLIGQDMKNWMTSYDNYENDLVSHVENNDEHQINYGTPDPGSGISKYPCGGCGAYLHCKDTAIPGYIPSEIFKNSFDPNGTTLSAILCQRCHFLKEYNVALQVRVSAEDYPKILKSIPLTSSLIVLLVDLTDFPCSVWPGIADILQSRVPLIIAGNKIDLLPKDNKEEYLNRIKQILYDNVRLCGFGSSNIKHVELVSAKTGFGIEKLITAIGKVGNYKGDVYIVGCTNVGKSSLFNVLLQSDLCKIQAADLIQRATTSPWPGTTLNLLKFPITRISGYRSVLRHERLKQLNAIEEKEKAVLRSADVDGKNPRYATLIGRIDRSFTKPVTQTPMDGFSVHGSSDLSGRVSMGVNENHPDYIASKWCYDTPGVVHPDQIIHLLTTEELVKTLPRNLIRPETFCVKPGTSLFIGGLARLDYVSGPRSIRFTVFRAKDLPLTICRLTKASDVYQDFLNTDLFCVPSRDEEGLRQWPGLTPAKSFRLQGKSAKLSTYDVVLSNAGWVAINCDSNNYEFQAWTPEKRGICIRDCILPKAVTLRGPRIRYSVAYKKHKFVI